MAGGGSGGGSGGGEACLFLFLCIQGRMAFLLLLLWTTPHPSASSPTIGCPTVCRCHDDVVTCHQGDLVHIPLVPEVTSVLDLDHNHISLLQNGSLHRANRLQTLRLQDNGILHLESGVFDALWELEVLRLGRNHLSSLPSNIFANNRRLQVLDLHANYFASVPENMMSSLHSLQVLNVSFNQLTTADLGPGFRFTTQLSVLDLSGNDLSSLESGSFEVMQSWDPQIARHINLSHCNLRHIDPSSFRHVPHPVTLSLEGNLRVPQSNVQSALQSMKLSTLEVIEFSHMNITDIKALVDDFPLGGLARLELAYNRLRVVSKGRYFFLANLRLLDLNHNEISVIESLGELSKLEYLYLAYNNLNALDKMMFEGLQELKVLDVSHNSITHIDDEPFLELFNLHTIDISSNQVYQFQIDGGLESLETLHAGWNRVSNLQFLQRLRRLSAVDLSHNMITRLGEEIFARGQKVKVANFSSNVISDISPNAFRFGDYDVLDLSHNRLTILNHHGWENVKVLRLENNILHNLTANSLRSLKVLRELHLQNNKVHSLHKHIFTDLINLTYLDVSFNPIGPCLELPDAARTLARLENLEVLNLEKTGLASLSQGLLQSLTSLVDLDLSHNRLGQVTGKVFSRVRRLDLSHNYLSRIDADILALNGGGTPRVVDLSSNPFECSCELVPLCQRLFSGGQELTVPHSDNRTLYQCASPDEWAGVSLAEYFENSRQCSHFEKAVVCSIVASCVIAVVIVIVITVCRYRAWKKQKRKTSRPSLGYKFVDETSLTSSSNSSSNTAGGGVGGAGAAGACASSVPSTTACLLSKQWV